MNESNSKQNQPLRAEELIERLFSETLADQQKYDQAIVRVLKDYLLVKTIPAKAGNQIADSLMKMAEQRATETQGKNG